MLTTMTPTDLVKLCRELREAGVDELELGHPSGDRLKLKLLRQEKAEDQKFDVKNPAPAPKFDPEPQERAFQDALVSHTRGTVLEGKSEEELEQLAISDPTAYEEAIAYDKFRVTAPGGGTKLAELAEKAQES